MNELANEWMDGWIAHLAEPGLPGDDNEVGPGDQVDEAQQAGDRLPARNRGNLASVRLVDGFFANTIGVGGLVL
jgi:hypothetical protein